MTIKKEKNTAKPYNFIFIGRSGCGKGTQAKLLMEKFGQDNMFYISTGALFRGLSEVDSQTGKKIAGILNEGGLPYDDLATTLWMHEIAYKVKENQGIIFDGCPRRLQEAKDMEEFLEFLERKDHTYIMLIDISREEAFERLTKRRICSKCGQLIPWVGELKELKVCNACEGELEVRPDDTPEVINNRLDYYDENVQEVVDYFEKKGDLIKINGEQTIENVFAEIVKAIEK